MANQNEKDLNKKVKDLSASMISLIPEDMSPTDVVCALGMTMTFYLCSLPKALREDLAQRSCNVLVSSLDQCADMYNDKPLN